MSVKTIWQCDGCDREQDMTGDRRHDWKVIELSAGGFEGYPTCSIGNMEARRFNLCPSCAQRLADTMAPLRWSRATAARAPKPEKPTRN